jgi:hypothetical protein
MDKKTRWVGGEDTTGLPDVFVHFELWIDEREGVVPRCLVPKTKRQGQSWPIHTTFFYYFLALSLCGTQYPHTANVRVFAVHMIGEDDDLKDISVYRFTGKNKNKNPLFLWNWGKKRERERDGQAFTIVGRFCRDIKGDPPVRSIERHRANFLQVPWARTCTH